MKKIFVQIASYRDSQLLPTLRDLFTKSSGKYEIIVGLVWQKDDNESLEEFYNDHRLKVLSYNWQESEGLGWARNKVQTLYSNEDYTLQLDSHHRFAQNWDEQLVLMLEKLKAKSDKPLLTAPPAGYDPNNDKILNPHVCITLPYDFKKGGTIQFRPIVLPKTGDNVPTEPIRARFISGGFYFTLGQHCKEFIYDPYTYFAGDEICLSVRSYTLGYDLYHPHINLIWHYYGRQKEPKHWGDHNNEAVHQNKIEKPWSARDYYSKQRVRQLLGEEDSGIDLGIYGLGKTRSIHDYEKYAGIDFTKKRIQNSAIKGLEPPVLFDTEYSYNKDFEKKSSVKIDNWEERMFLSNINNVAYFILEFISLHDSILYSEKFNKDLIHTITRPKIIIADNEPVAYRLRSFDINHNLLHKIQKDLKPNVSWF